MRRAWHALVAYAVITVVATWPLTRGLAKDVAWDLGDSLLNMWVLSWDCEQLLAILRGDVSRVATFFDANIFHPSPLTLAFAEHLFAQAIQILPVYAVTKNPILCYNLLFLSTFVVSGLGTYLFVRDLTKSSLAAFVAGLLFAFAPYRIPQSPHLQILSSQWMPFALYGIRRYFTAVERGERGVRPLAAASLALLANNLSCGYFLLYFSPFVAAYVLWELTTRHLVRQRRVWIGLGTAAVAVAVATLPFLIPYATLHEALGFERPATEIRRYSADVYSYATAMPDQPVWGRVMREYPKPEGDLFPGLVPLIFAALALVAWRPARLLDVPMSRVGARAPWLAPLLAAVSVFHFLLALITLLNRRLAFDVGIFHVQVTDINQLLIRGSVAAAILLVISPIARARLRAFLADRGFFVVMLVAAVWLSLGLVVEVRGRTANLFAPYALLYQYVPGFDGVRVPARLGMIVSLLLAVLAGYGVAVIAKRRHGQWPLAVLCIVFLGESWVFPFPVNIGAPSRGYNAPEARLFRPARAPAVYHEVRKLPPSAVLAELPLGEPGFDLRAVYYSTVHWRPLLNGYSGFFPPNYGRLTLALGDIPRFPELAMTSLRREGATHVIVHEGAYLESRGSQTTATLLQLGAREMFRAGSDVLLQLQ